METLHLGIDTRKFRPLPREEIHAFKGHLGFSDHDIVLGCAARLVPHKRIMDAISVLTVLGQKYSKLRLLVVGDGPMRNDLEQETRRHAVSRRVSFVGEQQGMCSFYNAMDVFLQTSEREGFGLAMVEAMACGVPVVAANVGAIPEIVGEAGCGILFPVGSIEAIAGAVESLLDSVELRRTIIAKALASVSERFDIEVMTKKLMTFYRDLCNRKMGRNR
jgi:glycosyltransferase involved in cell wall biosynthesis